MRRAHIPEILRQSAAEAIELLLASPSAPLPWLAAETLMLYIGLLERTERSFLTLLDTLFAKDVDGHRCARP